MKITVLQLSALIAVASAEVLHSPENPKLKLFSGPETDGVNSWIEAQLFCSKHGRIIATRNEWCNANWGNWGPDDVYDGIKEGVQWAAVRGTHVNEWVQVGHIDGKPDSACKLYSELYDVLDGTEGEEPTVDDTVYCQKPANCVGDHCEFQCPHKEGYYPDPTDCQAYCYCSGGGETSYWEKVESDEHNNYVWDPFCGNSNPLDVTNQPLGGMTGGCRNKDYYVDDKSYCSAGAQRRKLGGVKTWDRPEWGQLGNPEQNPGENNYILCAKMAEAPELPQTCAAVWGDPHVSTYDGLQYDCQGQGDYILQKSLDSGLELQGRFNRFSADKQATVLNGITIDTGRDDEPTIEVDFTNCWLRYWIDGVEKRLDYDFILHGTYATGTPAVHFINNWFDRWFWFPGSGISVHIRRKQSATLGCYFNVKLCLPEDIQDQERLVGLLGSPNKKASDDFMARDGTSLVHGGNTEWKAAYDYCTENWCIKDPAENHFRNPSDSAHCSEPYDPTIENAVKNAPEWLKNLCGGDAACMTEGIAGGVGDASDSITEAKTLKVDEVVEINEETEEKTEEYESKKDKKEDEGCVGLWGQCGGMSWAGATRCAVGMECEVLGKHYHQCTPIPLAPGVVVANKL